MCTIKLKIHPQRTVCVLAPFSEELLFRGYIYHSLRQYKTVGFSIIMTSLLFGCMHYDLFRLLPLTLVGICLNLVSIRSGTLWGSIVMHGTIPVMVTCIRSPTFKFIHSNSNISNRQQTSAYKSQFFSQITLSNR